MVWGIIKRCPLVTWVSSKQAFNDGYNRYSTATFTPQMHSALGYSHGQTYVLSGGVSFATWDETNVVLVATKSMPFDIPSPSAFCLTLQEEGYTGYIHTRARQKRTLRYASFAASAFAVTKEKSWQNMPPEQQRHGSEEWKNAVCPHDRGQKGMGQHPESVGRSKHCEYCSWTSHWTTDLKEPTRTLPITFYSYEIDGISFYAWPILRL